MASSLKNLSDYNPETVPSSEGMRFGIVVSEYHSEITMALCQGAIDTLTKYGASEEDIIVKYVPGSFELTLGAKLLAEYIEVDAVICLGCVLKGETAHADYINHSLTQGLTRLNIDNMIPFVFGVITPETYEQAKDRAGGKFGNKGIEAAITAIKMIALQDELIEESDFIDEEDDEEESF